MSVSTPAAVSSVAEQPAGPDPVPHDHAWRLQAVWHEDGLATEEFGCAGCGTITFR